MKWDISFSRPGVLPYNFNKFYSMKLGMTLSLLPLVFLTSCGPAPNAENQAASFTEASIQSDNSTIAKSEQNSSTLDEVFAPRPHPEHPIIMLYEGDDKYLIALDALKQVTKNKGNAATLMLLPKDLNITKDDVTGYTKGAEDAFENYAIFAHSYCVDQLPQIEFPPQAHYGPQGVIDAKASPYMTALYDYLCHDKFDVSAQIPEDVKNSVPIELLHID